MREASSTASLSRSDVSAHCLVGRQLAGLRLSQPLFYLGDEAKTFDRFVQARIVRQRVDHLESPILGGNLCHAVDCTSTLGALAAQRLKALRRCRPHR